MLADVYCKAYKLAGRLDFRGLPISIETKKGQIRKGVGVDGKEWKITMPFDYGYIRGTEGADGQYIDCFIGPNKNAEEVYVIHQCKEDDPTKYDEDKVMLGFSSLQDAIKAYKSAYVGVDLFQGSHTFNFTDFCDEIHNKSNHGKPLECSIDNTLDKDVKAISTDDNDNLNDNWEEQEWQDNMLRQIEIDEELNWALNEEEAGKLNQKSLERKHNIKSCASCESGDCELHAGGQGSGWTTEGGHIKHVFNYPKGKVWKQGDTSSKETINGVKLKPEKNVDYKSLTDHSISEPSKISKPKVIYTDKKTGETFSYSKHDAAGVVVVEPDNKVWLYSPKNYFGGYVNTFSKGTLEKGEDPQETAVRELHEETGLVAKIKGYLGDVERVTSMTRYYIGERVGGHPGDADPDETHNVQLVPIDKDLSKRLMDVNGQQTADHSVLDLLNKHLGTVEPSSGDRVDYMAEKITGQKGSNPGGTYKGSDGVSRYVKFYGNPNRGRGECVANTIYNDLGIGAPKSTVFTAPNGKEAFASDIISGGKILNEEGLNKENSQAILKGFAADVLTANWDSVGLVHDNILMKGGQANRIDNGAVFNYRAQGSEKPSSLLNKISEWNGLSNPSVNKEYSQVFKAAGYKSAMDIPDIKQQVQNIVNLEHSSDGWENYLSQKAPYLDSHQKDLIADMLSSRTELMAQKVGIKGPNLRAESDLDILYRIVAGGPGSGWFADNGHVGHGSITTYNNLKKAGWKPLGDAAHPKVFGKTTKWTHKLKPSEEIHTHDHGWVHVVNGISTTGKTTVELKHHLGTKTKGGLGKPGSIKHSVYSPPKVKNENVAEYGNITHLKALKDAGYVATSDNGNSTDWKQPGEHFDDHMVSTFASGMWSIYDKDGASLASGSGLGSTTLKNALANVNKAPSTSQTTSTPATPVATPQPSAKTPSGVITQVPAQNKIDAIKAIGYNLTANKGNTDVYSKPGDQYEIHLVPTDETHSKFNIVDSKTGKILDTGTYANDIQKSINNLKSQVDAGKQVGISYPAVAKKDVTSAWINKCSKVVSDLYDKYSNNTNGRKFSKSQIDSWKNNYVDAILKGAKEGQATLIKAAQGTGLYPEAAAKMGISPQQVQDTQALINNWSGASYDTTRIAFNNAVHGKEGANPGDILEYHVTQNFLNNKYPSGQVELTRGMAETVTGLGKQVTAFKGIAAGGDELADWSLDWKSGGAESWTLKQDNSWAEVRIRTTWDTKEIFSTFESNPSGLHISKEQEYIACPKDNHKVLTKFGATKAKIWSMVGKLPDTILSSIEYLRLHGWAWDIDYENHVLSFKEGPDIYSGISAEDAGAPITTNSVKAEALALMNKIKANKVIRNSPKEYTKLRKAANIKPKLPQIDSGGPGSGRKKKEETTQEKWNRLSKKPWKKQTDEEKLFVARHDTRQMSLPLKAGGKGSGWTTEEGHVSHKSQIAKDAIQGKGKEQFNIKMQVTAEANEKILASVLGGKSYNDTEPVDILVKTGGRLIGIEVKTLLYQKSDKLTMNHGAIPRKLKWQKKTGAELYTVAIDSRNPKNVTCYVRPGVGSWDLKYMAKVGSFGGVKKFLEINSKSKEELPDKLPHSKASLGLPKDHTWNKPSKALRNFSVLDNRSK